MAAPSAASLPIGKAESLKMAWFLASHVPHVMIKGMDRSLSFNEEIH